MINLLINGACGQMGRALRAAAAEQDGMFCVAAAVDAFCMDKTAYSSLSDVSETCDAALDFSSPDAAIPLLNYCVERHIPVVLGTTGLNTAELDALSEAAKTIPVFRSGNMSLGVNLQMRLVREAALTLGPQYDVEITETHHNLKKDAPSGTALMLADAVRSTRNAKSDLIFGRHGRDCKRQAGEIGIHSLRGGSIVGEHVVSFFGPDEVIEIRHRAFSKQVFALGALRAAAFLIGQPAGLYSMDDLIGRL